jgi:D-sedoheptulose 7-phosphate isomerase
VGSGIAHVANNVGTAVKKGVVDTGHEIGRAQNKDWVKALEAGNAINMKTFAILAYTGGFCKGLAQHLIHFEIDDMQIAEDLQLIVGHICMQWLCDNPVR